MGFGISEPLKHPSEITRAYDPMVCPSEYGNWLFGCSLFMDEEWHQISLQTGLDLTNV